jgi:hypothetical protein
MASRRTSPAINGSGRRKLASWIDTFIEHTGRFLPTPEIFRRWAAISAVGATLERKVWIDTGQVLFPNTYVFLVGASGTGKTRVIDHATDILKEIEDFHFAPTSVTRASLVDVLSESKRKLPFKGPMAEMVEYNTLYLALDELSTFMPEYNADIVSALTKFYDNNWYKEAKRVGHVRHDIDKPNMNILTGSTPTNLMRIFKQDVWSQGLTGRSFIVYSGEDIDHDPLANKTVDKPTALVHDIQVIFTLYGRVTWTDEYHDLQKAWFKNGSSEPDHPLLEDYNNRRKSHLMKLAMISSADRGDDLLLKREDFERARTWLLEVEKDMTQVFSAGYTTADRQVMDEIIAFLKRDGPQSKRALTRKASYLIESYRLDKVLEIMVKTGEIKNIGNDRWAATSSSP